MFDALDYDKVRPHFEEGLPSTKISQLIGMPVQHVRIHRNLYNELDAAEKRRQKRIIECENYLNKIKK